MSKFITKSRLNKINQINQNWSDIIVKDYWQSKPISKEEIEQEKRYKEQLNFLQSEKQRIESIPLEELSFRDLYKEPFREWEYLSNRVYSGEEFAFQFEFFGAEEIRKKVIKILNQEITDYERQEVENRNGEIFVKGKHFITVRNWGKLHGSGGYNLNTEHAGKIQDTLAEYIVEKLNK